MGGSTFYDTGTQNEREPYPYRLHSTLSMVAPEPSAENFVGSNIRGSMPGNHTHQ